MDIPTTSMTTNMFKALVGAALAVASCAALAQPAIKVNGGTTLTFASTPVLVTNSTPTPSTITLENTGTEMLTITGIEKSGANATDFVATGTCVPVGASVTVNAGATCTIGATFMSAGRRFAFGDLHGPVQRRHESEHHGLGHCSRRHDAEHRPQCHVDRLQYADSRHGERAATDHGDQQQHGPGFDHAGDVAPNPEFASTTDLPQRRQRPGFSAEICTIDITFTPAMAGARTGTVTITSNVSGRRGRFRCRAPAWPWAWRLVPPGWRQAR